MARLRGLAPGLILLAAIASAQTEAPPARLRAVGLNTADPAVQTRFWTELLPCTTSGEKLDCGGVEVLLTAKKPSGGSAGTVINHIGFFVPNMEDYVPKVSAAGYKYTRPPSGIQIIIDGPDGVRVELTSDPNATVPIRFHHIHFSTPDPKAMQAWYAKFFGAVPGKRAQWDAGDLPNANLTYAQSNGPVEPTAGRAISAVQFEVDSVHRVGDLLRSAGLKCNEMQFMSGPNVSIFGDTIDPWGTSITLRQIPK